MRIDAQAARLDGARELHGAAAVAASLLGKAQAARTALIDGQVGAVVAPAGKLLLALRLTFVAGRIAAIEAVADAELPSHWIL